MWVLNVFLLLCFLFNRPVYEEFKAAGVPCYGYYSWSVPSDPQPACFYDPSNTNPFLP